MKRLTGLLLGSSLLLGGLGTVAAQEKSQGTTPPPKVLVIFREFLKPGKGGKTHEKAESAFVQAFSRAKWPTHYLAVDSLSGKPRSLFLTGYDSFEAWEKDSRATQKNATLAAAIDRAGTERRAHVVVAQHVAGTDDHGQSFLKGTRDADDYVRRS